MKTMIQTKMQILCETIISLVANYRQMATKAVKDGDGHLFVPGWLDLGTFIGLLLEPNRVTTSNEGSEPSYISEQEGLHGKNSDHTLHAGFIVIDPIDRKIVKIIHRTGQVSYDSSCMSLHLATWSGYCITIDCELGAQTVLKTKNGVRGIIPVVVVRFNDGRAPQAFNQERPIELI